MDSLQIIMDQNIQKRRDQIPSVEKLILEEMVNFFSWYNALDIVPTIKSMKTFFENIRLDELDKIKNKINEDDYLKIEDMTKRMMGRLLHNPIIKLRGFAESGINSNETLTNTFILKELFNLGDLPANGDEKNKEENFENQ
jgi:glutamyl-tRNA reductase